MLKGGHKMMITVVYELINENFGIYFKDGTQIIYIPNKNKFCYIDRKGNEIINGLSDIYQFDNDLKIKIKIMNYFYNNILGKNQQLFQIIENSIEEDISSGNNDLLKENNIYLLNEKTEDSDYLSKVSNLSNHKHSHLV